MNHEPAAPISTRSLARLEALAVLQGLSVGVLASSSPSDFTIVLAADAAAAQALQQRVDAVAAKGGTTWIE